MDLTIIENITAILITYCKFVGILALALLATAILFAVIEPSWNSIITVIGLPEWRLDYKKRVQKAREEGEKNE